MPSIKDETTVEAIAREYTSNGRKKGIALQTVGYANSYSIDGGRGCNVVFSSVRVKAAIARIDEEQAQIGHRTVEGLDKMYQAAFDASNELKQPSAMVSAVTGIARLYGMDKDTHVNEDTAQELSPEQARRYRDMAGIANKDKIAGPQLRKEKIA